MAERATCSGAHAPTLTVLATVCMACGTVVLGDYEFADAGLDRALARAQDELRAALAALTPALDG